jgi:hypothetical protein
VDGGEKCTGAWNCCKGRPGAKAVGRGEEDGENRDGELFFFVCGWGSAPSSGASRFTRAALTVLTLIYTKTENRTRTKIYPPLLTDLNHR